MYIHWLVALTKNDIVMMYFPLGSLIEANVSNVLVLKDFYSTKPVPLKTLFGPVS